MCTATSQQLTGTELPMHHTAERKQQVPLQEPAQQDDQYLDDISALDITALPLLCDNCNATIKSFFTETMETGDQESCDQVVLRGGATQQVISHGQRG